MSRGLPDALRDVPSDAHEQTAGAHGFFTGREQHFSRYTCAPVARVLRSSRVRGLMLANRYRRISGLRARLMVLYQVYPRSFQDTDDNGVGDLSGIRERLDYIARLGVDQIWISPFFSSPQRDFGYDVSDFRAVDPLFGTLDDFRQLVSEARSRGLGIVVDLVASHTSDEHVWFAQSRDRANGKADWYLWADAKPDGSPPNNWMSVFGGSAWQWDARRHQYYYHAFLGSQPDLKRRARRKRNGRAALRAGARRAGSRLRVQSRRRAAGSAREPHGRRCVAAPAARTRQRASGTGTVWLRAAGGARFAGLRDDGRRGRAPVLLDDPGTGAVIV